MRLKRRQRLADPGDKPEVIGRRGGGEHVVADFVGQYFHSVVLQPVAANLRQVDHHALVGQPDHREAAAKPGARGFDRRGA